MVRYWQRKSTTVSLEDGKVSELVYYGQYGYYIPVIYYYPDDPIAKIKELLRVDNIEKYTIEADMVEGHQGITKST